MTTMSPPERPAVAEPLAPEVGRTPSRSLGPNLVWLLAAAPFLFLSNGRWMVPVAAWIGPPLMVRFLRSTPTRTALVAGYAMALLVRYTQWWNMVPLSKPLYFGIGAVLELVVFLPYVADARLSRRLGGVASTLVLPTLLTTAEFLLARTGPYGSWGSVAYSQYDRLSLMQVASVAGIWGITFMIGWWAASTNTAWERRAEPAGRRAAVAFVAVAAAVLVFGGLRLATTPLEGPTVRVAGVVPSVEVDDPARGLALAGDLLERTSDAARAGADVVAWPEGSVTLFAHDEAGVIARAAEIAKAESCYVALAYYARVDETSQRYENKSVLVDPAGTVAWEYVKSWAVPGHEEAYMVRGTAPAPTVATPHGRFSTLICYDADHAQLVARTMREADVLLLPANDWFAIDALHSNMAIFRAIESGVSVVRVVLNGRGVAVDPRGRIRSSADAFEAPGSTMWAIVPTTRAWTVYSAVGDLFAWLAAAGALVLIVMAVRGRRTAPAPLTRS